MNWLKLETPEQLNTIKESSSVNRVVIFKHSTRCSISHMALTRLERDWQPSEMKDVKTYCLDLLKNRGLSNSVAEEFNVQHESPQVMVIENGKVIYDRSHNDIRYTELAGIATKKELTN